MGQFITSCLLCTSYDRLWGSAFLVNAQFCIFFPLGKKKKRSIQIQTNRSDVVGFCFHLNEWSLNSPLNLMYIIFVHFSYKLCQLLLCCLRLHSHYSVNCAIYYTVYLQIYGVMNPISGKRHSTVVLISRLCILLLHKTYKCKSSSIFTSKQNFTSALWTVFYLKLNPVSEKYLLCLKVNICE